MCRSAFATVLVAACAALAGAQEDLVPLEVKLPKPQFVSTRANRQKQPEGVEPLRTTPRPPLLVPKGLVNLAAGKKVTGSDPEPMVGEYALITDGDKEGQGGSYVECGPGLQYIQIDLGQAAHIHAIALWLSFDMERVYHDVIVQVADDPDFITNARILFNNDRDNSSGLGIGEDLEYFETHEGKLIAVNAVKARYVRVYTHGNTENEMNRFTEVEVYGRAAKD
jgi:hypothetical protein